MPSRVLARRVAALDTCKVLHQAQELDDNLIPVGKESFRVHEEEETTLALEELDEAIPRDSSEPRPGTTKRRQYYYKRVGETVRFAHEHVNPLKPSGYYMYHLLYHTKTLHSTHTVYLCVLYGSHNKQRLFPQTALTGWAL
jgi:endoribonuclease Dicer